MADTDHTDQRNDRRWMVAAAVGLAYGIVLVWRFGTGAGVVALVFAFAFASELRGTNRRATRSLLITAFVIGSAYWVALGFGVID